MDLYYIPTWEEISSNPHYYGNFNRPDRRIYRVEDMPTAPIDPKNLLAKVKDYLHKSTNVQCDAADEQIEMFCKLFNQTIYSNKIKERLTLVHSAQTGTGKSLSLKTYVSLLKQESSLIVVSKVAEAIEYCHFINKASDNASYASCYYSITPENKKTTYRVDKEYLRNYRCIVISHAMFQQLNQDANVDLFKYEKLPRDLTVVDEGTTLYNSYQITKKDIIRLQNIEHKLQIKHPNESYYISDAIIALMEDIQKDLLDRKSENQTKFFSHSRNIYDKLLEDYDSKLQLLSKLYKDKITKLFTELEDLSGISNSYHKSRVNDEIENIINTAVKVFSLDYERLNYYKSTYNECIFQVDNFLNRLGTATVLDATSNINEFYKVAYIYGFNIFETTVNRFRKYNNLTVYKAKGYNQGRSSIFENLPMRDVYYNAQMYMSHAYNILQDTNDKMLIITHKGFKKHLSDINQDERIRFTHWGDHVGKNDWNDCNKVMIIGWNYINELEHLFKLFNALGSEELGAIHATDTILKQFSITQIVDDLVQGVMRSHARIIATSDGDCKKNRTLSVL